MYLHNYISCKSYSYRRIKYVNTIEYSTMAITDLHVYFIRVMRSFR